MLDVIGYEGGVADNRPLVWGCAAIRNGKGIYNALLPSTFPLSEERWAAYINDRVVTATQVAIPVEKEGPYFVLDLRLDLLDRKPYAVDPYFPAMHGVIATARGDTRGYYVFASHECLKSFFYFMCAGKYELVPTAWLNAEKVDDGGMLTLVSEFSLNERS